MESLFSDILLTTYIFLPAYTANTVPVLAKKAGILKKLAVPVDFHSVFKGKRITGDNKTIRGFATGIGMAVLVGLLQYFAYTGLIGWFGKDLQYLHKDLWGCLFLSILLGFGALFGDSAKSFIKRQLGRPCGSTFVPFDQTDFIAGSLLFALPLFPIRAKFIVIYIITGFFLSILASALGKLTGMKKKWI